MSLSERWDFTILLFASLLAASMWPRLGRRASALVFPAALLLIRKLALFIPISGSVSTQDHIVFWSTKAYWYSFIFIAIGVGVMALIRFRADVNWDSLGCAYFIVPVVLIALSASLLPFSGWRSHLFSPLVAVIGAIKILLVSPILAPIAWLTLFLQIVLLVFTGGISGREVNKFVLVCVLISGFAHFAVQLVAPTPPIVNAIKTWPIENPAETGTHIFLEVWANKLPQISELRVNVVDKQIPDLNREKAHQEVVQNLNSWGTDLWPSQRPRNIVLAGLISLFVFTMIERVPIGDTWSSANRVQPQNANVTGKEH